MRTHHRSGVLLAGGASSRFGGSPKGLVPFGGARLADRPLAALHAVCDEVAIAANDARTSRWFPGVRAVEDTQPFRGGLSALATACIAASHDTLLVCAWDMPFVTPALLEELAAAVDGGALCAVPTHADGTIEPLCAAYNRPAALSAIRTILANDTGHSAQQLPVALGGVAWMIAEHLDVATAAKIFSNVNTPADLQGAEQQLAAERHA